eukprot:gene11888-27515_t
MLLLSHLFLSAVAAANAVPGCEIGDTFSSIDGLGPILKTERGNVVIEAGDFDTFAENADQKLQTTFSSVEDTQQKLREEVEAAAKLRREAESEIAQSITDSFATQDSIMKDILAEIKKSNTLAETTNKGIAKLAGGAGSKWLAAGDGAKVSPGDVQEIYGRNFLAGATSIYKVTVQDVDSDSEAIDQPVLEVGQSVIKFKAVHGAPEGKDAVYKTNVKVTELGEDLEGPEVTLTWQAAAPKLFLNNPAIPATGLAFDTALSATFTIPFQVTDGDHDTDDVELSAVSGNEKAILTKALKITATENSAQRQLVITGVVTAGVSIIKVTAKDPLGATTVLSIKVKVLVKSSVRINGWALVMKIRGSDGKSAKNVNDCEQYQYDNKVWSSKSEDGETSDFSLKPANRKLKDYMNVKFQTIRVCSGALNSKTGGANCHAYTFESTWNSAQEMFTECDKGRNHQSQGRNCRDQKNGALKAGFDRIFNIKGQRNCALQLPGFSQVGQDHARTRWGWMSNLPSQGCQPADGQDSDAAIGLGLHAQDNQCNCGAGNTPWYNSGSGNTGCAFCKNAWLWVKIA